MLNACFISVLAVHSPLRIFLEISAVCAHVRRWLLQVIRISRSLATIWRPPIARSTSLSSSNPSPLNRRLMRTPDTTDANA
jgi:hypothetical protein